MRFEFAPLIGDVGVASPTEKKLEVAIDDVDVALRVGAEDPRELAKMEAQLQRYLYDAGSTEEGRAKLNQLFGNATAEQRDKNELQAALEGLKEELQEASPGNQALQIGAKAVALIFAVLGAKTFQLAPADLMGLLGLLTGIGGAGSHLLLSGAETGREQDDKGVAQKTIAFLGYATFIRNFMRLVLAGPIIDRINAESALTKDEVDRAEERVQARASEAAEALVKDARGAGPADGLVERARAAGL